MYIICGAHPQSTEVLLIDSRRVTDGGTAREVILSRRCQDNLREKLHDSVDGSRLHSSYKYGDDSRVEVFSEYVRCPLEGYLLPCKITRWSHLTKNRRRNY